MKICSYITELSPLSFVVFLVKGQNFNNYILWAQWFIYSTSISMVGSHFCNPTTCSHENHTFKPAASQYRFIGWLPIRCAYFILYKCFVTQYCWLSKHTLSLLYGALNFSKLPQNALVKYLHSKCTLKEKIIIMKW